MKRLQGMNALITGAASDKGIGRAIAHAFAREGARVACVDIDLAGCKETARQIVSQGGVATALQADVSCSKDVQQAVQQAIGQLDGLDILVNNAGFVRFAYLLDVSQELWERTLAVNLTGYFLFSQAVARHMAAQSRPGNIINISSVSADRASIQKGHYCVSKAGVKMLTESFAMELASKGIRVNAIAPGDIETNIVQDDSIKKQVAETDFKKAVPLERRGLPGDIIGAAVFLASHESAYITGTTITVDGGLSTGLK